MNVLLTSLVRGKKLIIALFAIIPLLLTGTLAHAGDDHPRRTLVKQKVGKTKKVKTVKSKKTKSKARRTGCYEYDDGRYERDDDCDRHERFDRDDD